MFGIEPIVSCVLGKHYVTELYSQSLNFWKQKYEIFHLDKIIIAFNVL
jgi:hypothetical protein